MLEDMANAAKRPFWVWPIGGVFAFVGLYAASASLYPGGTYAEPARVGFSLVDNYWCDLLDATTYGGHPNPGRPVAISAMVVLSAGLAVLWWTAPALFPEARRRAVLVRVTGLSSGLITPLVATSFHDTVIHISSLLGTIALVTTMSALDGRGGKALVVVAIATLALAVMNYMSWVTGVGLFALPLLQKGAFALFLSWAVLFAMRLRRGIPE